MTDIALDEKALSAARNVVKARDIATLDYALEVGIAAYLRASPSQVAPVNPATPSSTTSVNTTKETDMPKLTSKIARELVTRIEALNDQIHEVYREANDYDGINNVNVIRDIVKAREEIADQKCIADGLLEALDLDEDEE